MRSVLTPAVVIALALLACGDDDDEPADTEAPATEAPTGTEAPTDTEAPTATEAPTDTEAPRETDPEHVVIELNPSEVTKRPGEQFVVAADVYDAGEGGNRSSPYIAATPPIWEWYGEANVTVVEGTERTDLENNAFAVSFECSERGGRGAYSLELRLADADGVEVRVLNETGYADCGSVFEDPPPTTEPSTTEDDVDGSSDETAEVEVSGNCSATTDTDYACSLDPLPADGGLGVDCPHALGLDIDVPDELHPTGVGIWTTDNDNVWTNWCFEGSWDPADFDGDFGAGWSFQIGIGPGDSGSASMSTFSFGDDGPSGELTRDLAEIFVTEGADGAWFMNSFSGLNSGGASLSGTTFLDLQGPGGQSTTIVIDFPVDSVLMWPGDYPSRYAGVSILGGDS